MNTFKIHINLLVICLTALCFGTAAHAQTSAVANVTLVLEDVISIENGSTAAGDILDFSYKTSADYNSAKTVRRPAALMVTSTSNFEVKVKAAGAFFQNGENTIPVSTLRIRAVAGGTMDGQYKTLNLSSTDQVLVSDATAGTAKSLDIEYSITAAKAKTDIFGKRPGTYTQTVTYTAVAL